jgi:4-hydroxy-3-polyprenylbenzoate decarboxylase
MGYTDLQSCIADLERTGQLVRIEEEIDPYLEAAALHRRVQSRGGPALWFRRVKGTSFTMVSNLFGTSQRIRYLFRDTLDVVRQLVSLRRDPQELMRRPWRYWKLPLWLNCLRPQWVRRGPVLAGRTTLSQLPQVQCWPADGGPFITLPQVYTEHPDYPGWRHSNLGMYRVQIAGNDYLPDRECGLHYQIHRGIGVHHAAALRRGERLPVCISVGGPPALAVAAVMPLPEGMPEIAFAGILAGRRIRLCPTPKNDPPFPLPLFADADFVITGYVEPGRTKPEGPFGDHLGYYSLRHDFPVMTVTAIYHRADAIWPFTVVGRPPQEDSCFGELIHELTGPVIPSVLPGVRAIHAVDAAGVHPLLLAIGSERYVPYAPERQPQELLTQASAILGQGQLSLAKYLFIAAQEDDPSLNVHDVPAFFRHVLERVQPERDLHFHTQTTIDTLDYSAGCGLNVGSKVVFAVAGKKRRELARSLPSHWPVPSEFGPMRLILPGIVAIQGPPCPRIPQLSPSHLSSDPDLNRLLTCWDEAFRTDETLWEGWPLITVVDDADFVARSLQNWLWVVFTRSDPARDIHGVAAFIHNKHWGCRGPLVIDARLKPHMPDPLEEDPAIQKRIDRFFTRTGPLAGWE